jgi:hypothetical protein
MWFSLIFPFGLVWKSKLVGWAGLCYMQRAWWVGVGFGLVWFPNH